MERFICATCGVQYQASESEPAQCPICGDERQYIGHAGQKWTTQSALHAEGRKNVFEQLEPNLTSIRTVPEFCIGQQALLVQTPHGNLLWDCVSYLDEETVAAVQALGGIKYMHPSHPHLQGSITEWAERFDAQIYMPAVDREWLMGDKSRVHFYEEERRELLPGVTVHRIGGHFPGSSVLHWQAGAEGRGVLLTGDTVAVTPDRDWVSFMYSYPNLIPLPAREVARIRDRVTALAFENLYDGWFFKKGVLGDARAKVERSANRYIAALA